MARDQRFPGYTLFRQVSARTGTPVIATIFCGILIEVVLAIFATQTNTLTNLFSAATLLPAIIYLSTVILYISTHNKLPQTQGFSLGVFEWPVVILALVWLIFEISIFRDASFAIPWLYIVIMFGLGLLYFIWMLIRQPDVLRTPSQIEETATGA